MNRAACLHISCMSGAIFTRFGRAPTMLTIFNGLDIDWRIHFPSKYSIAVLDGTPPFGEFSYHQRGNEQSTAERLMRGEGIKLQAGQWSGIRIRATSSGRARAGYAHRKPKDESSNVGYAPNRAVGIRPIQWRW